MYEPSEETPYIYQNEYLMRMECEHGDSVMCLIVWMGCSAIDGGASDEELC